MVYTCWTVHELCHFSFLYIHTILNAPVETKHNMFTHFLGWFNEPSACYDCITFFWIIISPMFVVSHCRWDNGLLQGLPMESSFIGQGISS